MSIYSLKPLDFQALRTVPLHGRGGKVTPELFAKPVAKGGGLSEFFDRLPRILAADTLRAVAARILEARRKQRAILWGIGGHVIKVGLAPVLLDLADRGFLTGLAMNGSASIHDYEIAVAGHSSEDVEAVLPDGSFGSAEETGHDLNRAIRDAAGTLGMGEAVCRCISEKANPEYAGASLLYGAYQRKLPVTIHVAVGTDTPHTHPLADGAAIGEATYRDFRLFSSMVRGLDDGGVYINLGSAVIMPEVFLKAVSVVRNLGYPLRNFSTVNFDFLQHYRPSVNVVKRPHANAGGQGYALTGHHEIMIPLLAAMLVEQDNG
ncbi:MAG: hypothetical protein FJW30_02110 [Acidobacteria bacterium]|nr:hypothetical protein [Acidobacteriota bacterium]